VVDATSVSGHLGAAELDRLDLPADPVRLLFKTRNSALWDDPHFVADFVPLRAGVAVLETLDLRSVEPGPWHLTCLPLRIPGADGAPARALLSRD